MRGYAFGPPRCSGFLDGENGGPVEEWKPPTTDTSVHEAGWFAMCALTRAFAKAMDFCLFSHASGVFSVAHFLHGRLGLKVFFSVHPRCGPKHGCVFV